MANSEMFLLAVVMLFECIEGADFGACKRTVYLVDLGGVNLRVSLRRCAKCGSGAGWHRNLSANSVAIRSTFFEHAWCAQHKRLSDILKHNATCATRTDLGTPGLEKSLFDDMVNSERLSVFPS